MIGTFPGKLALVEGDEVDVDLEIAGGRLRLTTGVSEIGAWPLDACLVTALPSGAYELTLDGERVAFSPDHPDAFSAVVARMAPVAPPTQPAGGAYDLEAALDQVLGGNGNYVVPGLAEESADEIAVTLEALFATAYPDFDMDEDPEAQPSRTDESEEGRPTAVASSVDDSSAAEPPPPALASEPIVEMAPDLIDEKPPTPAEEQFASSAFFDHSDPKAGSPAAQVADDVDRPAGDDSLLAPVDVAGWQAEPEVPAWSPDIVATPGLEHDGDEEAGMGVDPELPALPEPDPILPSELGAKWRPAAFPTEPDVDEHLSPEDSNAGEDDDADDDEEWPIADPGEEPYPGRVADTDSEEDPGLPGGAGTSNGNGHGGIEPGHWPSRPSPRTSESGGSGAFHPDRGITQDTEFDLERAAASAGYSMPRDELVQEVAGRIPARRGIGAMFSKTAGERLAAVSGSVRDRPDIDADDEETESVADQILASQEQLRSGSKVVRFTPTLVKKVTIGLLVLFTISGLVLITPAVVGFLIDRVETEAENVLPTSTTIAGSASGVPVVPPTTIPSDATTLPGIAAVDSTPVFELDVDQFTERWNSKGSEVSESLTIAGAPSDRVFGLGFTRFLGLEGVVGDSGSIERYTVVVDPLGDPQDDQLGIQTFGVAIKVAEPGATGPELSAILLEMGLDVTNPVVDGLGGTTTRNGVSYALAYEAERQLIRLTVSEAGAGSDTAP